jgi:DNA-binding NarL/FixJ family response regulator
MGGHGAAAGLEALVRARDADRLIWSTQSGSDRHRRTRNRAVAEALAAGISIEQIADDLGVRIRDVEQMAASVDHESDRNDRSGA